MLIGMVMNIVTKHRTGRTKEKGRLNIFQTTFCVTRCLP
ncbi:hypothetical protein MCC93_10520 [Morococcus cerebrosus]|uniref:Uncharacterized protein n=1 Tax=Morococcus cerebrosus TaxID=1056807 RepID=A0A0C1GRH3_9NEIS|nr:hypothetical protein MCC93_10520 [Morococcus cerebrosus]